MSLLPIIYSSILIFSGILIFVVIVSYVSFKVKTDENSYSESDKYEYDFDRIAVSEPQFRELRSEDNGRAKRKLDDQVLSEKNLHGRKLKPATPEPKSEYRSERKKLHEKNFHVLYIEKDIFSRSKSRTNEERFSIIKDISENLGKSGKTKYAAVHSLNSAQIIQVSASDYLRFYENY